MKNQAYRMACSSTLRRSAHRPAEGVLHLYYNEDLSLAEIAENYGITRQGVRDVIVRARPTSPKSRTRPA
jgi:DNA-binding transcriptional regulator LsrR (DeoR family)